MENSVNAMCTDQTGDATWLFSLLTFTIKRERVNEDITIRTRRKDNQDNNVWQTWSAAINETRGYLIHQVSKVNQIRTFFHLLMGGTSKQLDGSCGVFLWWWKSNVMQLSIRLERRAIRKGRKIKRHFFFVLQRVEVKRETSLQVSCRSSFYSWLFTFCLLTTPRREGAEKLSTR